MTLLTKLICSDISEIEHLEEFKQLVLLSDINAEVAPNLSLIHLAIFHKKHHFLKMLIEHGANLEACGPQKLTPIQNAVAFGAFQAVEMLVHAGANLQVLWTPSEQSNSWSLLDLLTLNNKRSGEESKAILKLLIDKGVKFIRAQWVVPSLSEYSIEEILRKSVLDFNLSQFKNDPQNSELVVAEVELGIPLTELSSKATFKSAKDNKVRQAPILFSKVNNQETANTNKLKDSEYKPGVPKFKRGFLEKRL